MTAELFAIDHHPTDVSNAAECGIGGLGAIPSEYRTPSGLLLIPSTFRHQLILCIIDALCVISTKQMPLRGYRVFETLDACLYSHQGQTVGLYWGIRTPLTVLLCLST